MEREGGRDYLPLCHFLALCTIQGGLCQFHEMSLQCRAGARRVFTDEGGSGLGGYAMSNKYIPGTSKYTCIHSFFGRVESHLHNFVRVEMPGSLRRLVAPPTKPETSTICHRRQHLSSTGCCCRSSHQELSHLSRLTVMARSQKKGSLDDGARSDSLYVLVQNGSTTESTWEVEARRG